MQFSELATADWHLLGDKYFRKTAVYQQMLWQIPDLDLVKASVSKLGGPIAIYRHDAKLFTLSSTAMTRPTLQIFTQSGRLLSQLSAVDKPGGKLVSFGWTDDERLICAYDGGNARVYTLHGDYTQFSLGIAAKETGVREAKFWESGVVVLSGTAGLMQVISNSHTFPISKNQEQNYWQKPRLNQCLHAGQWCLRDSRRARR